MDYIALNKTDCHVKPDVNAIGTQGAMTVGELREALENFDDDTVVMIENGYLSWFGLDYVESVEAQNYERDFDDCAWDDYKIARHSREDA